MHNPMLSGDSLSISVEMLSLIFSKLMPKDLIALLRTCKGFQEYKTNDYAIRSKIYNNKFEISLSSSNNQFFLGSKLKKNSTPVWSVTWTVD